VPAADRWYLPTRTCSQCQVVNGDLTLTDRTWTCPRGGNHDRDTNAALHVLGLAA